MQITDFFTILALTPLERLEAMRRLDSSFTAQPWFIKTAVAVIVVLTGLLIWVTWDRRDSERRFTAELFEYYSKKRGLSRREQQLLRTLAHKAHLKDAAGIFTMDNAFELGAAKMTVDTLKRPNGAEEGKQLKVELFFIREKLGFQKVVPATIQSSNKAKRLSSRHIPVGKTVQVRQHRANQVENIEGTVTANNDIEFTVKLPTKVKTAVGRLWRLHYSFGASLWEFDTSVAGCSDSVLVLNHSENVRSINRRRFVRVPVYRPALIANFPFTRTLPSAAFDEIYRSSSKPDGDNAGLPCFFPAVVTELAGPGLRLETELEAKTGQRVLIIFGLYEEAKAGGTDTAQTKDGKVSIVEDIGRIVHSQPTGHGFSIAVELIGLGEHDVNRLIRITNLAGIKGKGDNITGLPISEQLFAQAQVPRK